MEHVTYGCQYEPNKRVMEFLQFHFRGWAEAEELARLMAKYTAKPHSVRST